MATQSEIQVTHRIIQLFENSKMQTDEDIDSLPGIYAVIDLDGQIFKGNRTLGKIFGTSHENLLGQRLTPFFSPVGWERMRTKMRSCLDSMAPSDEIQVDLVVEGKSHNYVWNFAPIPGARSDLPPMATVVGRDITDLISATQRNTRMGMELEMASAIQRALFPPDNATFGASSVSGFYLSASECAGDWWNYSILGGKLFLWIGDVEGHGVSAALVTGGVRATVALLDKAELRPGKILSILSRAVRSIATEHKLMTFCVVSIDLETGDVVYASAAHEPGFLVRNKREPYRVADILGLRAEASSPLGINLEYVYAERTEKLTRGDRLIFFTDGILDVTNGTEQRWSRPALHRTLVPFLNKCRGASDLVNEVKESIATFRQNTPLMDDVTFLTFQY